MWITCYTDASFKEGKSSWACWLRCELGRVVNSGLCPPSVQTSMGAECYAVLQALQRVQKEFPTTTGVLINTDCNGLLRAFWPWSKKLSGEAATYQKLIIELGEKSGLQFRTKHVKGHTHKSDTRSYLNKQVDKLAGEHTK